MLHFHSWWLYFLFYFDSLFRSVWPSLAPSLLTVITCISSAPVCICCLVIPLFLADPSCLIHPAMSPCIPGRVSGVQDASHPVSEVVLDTPRPMHLPRSWQLAPRFLPPLPWMLTRWLQSQPSPPSPQPRSQLIQAGLQTPIGPSPAPVTPVPNLRPRNSFYCALWFFFVFFLFWNSWSKLIVTTPCCCTPYDMFAERMGQTNSWNVYSCSIFSGRIDTFEVL